MTDRVSSTTPTKYKNIMPSRQEIDFHQLLKFAWEHSAFYRDFYGSHGIREQDLTEVPVQNLPFLTKQVLMENFDRAVTDPRLKKEKLEQWIETVRDPHTLYDDDLIVLHSSGSSGSPAIFTYDRMAWHVMNATAAPYFPPPEVGLNRRTRVATYLATHSHFAGVTANALLPKSVYEVRLFSLSDASELVIKQLNAFQPDRLAGYSSSIEMLAEMAIQGHLRIHPQTIFVSGDVLTPSIKHKIQEAWNTRAYVIYATSESIYLGIKEPTQEEMKVVDELNILEVLDPENQPVAPGDIGRTVLTNLFNQTLPILRYELGDYVIRGSGKTQTQASTILDIRGRANDALPVILDNGVPDTFNSYLLSSFHVNELKKIQFISRRHDNVELHYIANKNIDGNVRHEFQRILNLKKASKLSFRVQRVEKISPHPDTGKFQLVKIDDGQDSCYPKIDRNRILPKDIEDSYQLTPFQHHIVFQSLSTSRAGIYLEQLVWIVREELYLSVFERAWEQVVNRHSVLRTSFCWDGSNGLVQRVHSHVSVHLDYQDWCQCSPEQREHRLERFLQSDRQRELLLDQAPLMRLAIFRFSQNEFRCVWTFHQALLDGRSKRLLINELSNLYRTLRKDEMPQRNTPLPFRIFIDWLAQKNVNKSENYWSRMLGGVAAPTSVRSPSKQLRRSVTGGVSTQSAWLSEETSNQLQSLAKGFALGIDIILQGAWALLLCRYSRDNNVVFGAMRDGREETIDGVETMVGLFSDIVPVRINVDSKAFFRSWIQDLRSQWFSMHEFKHTPLEIIQQGSEIPPGTSLFESVLAVENDQVPSDHLPQLPTTKEWEYRLLGAAYYPLVLTCSVKRQILLTCTHDQDLIDDDNTTRMLANLKSLLEGIAATPNRRLHEFPLLAEAERNQVLQQWNKTERDYPKHQRVHTLFEDQVEQRTHAIAIVFEDEQLTYQELNRRSNQLGHFLRRKGVGPEVQVGIYVERSAEMVVGILGILKTGAAYVPLDPGNPTEHSRFILEDTQAAVLITQSKFFPQLSEVMGDKIPQMKDGEKGTRFIGLQSSTDSIICLDTDWEQISQEEEANPDIRTAAENLAYVIYTSGSSGRPKGVAVEHQQLQNYLLGILERIDRTKNDSFATVSTIAADLGNTAVFSSLCTGGTLHVISQDRVSDTKMLGDYFDRHSIDCLKIVPSHLAALQTTLHPERVLPRSLLILGGEASDYHWVQRIQAETPGCSILNHYGPTETTIGVLTYPVKPSSNSLVSNNLPLGRPIANTQIFLLDQDGNPVPIGMAGELFISGLSVTRGYLNRPDMTAERFIPNPFIAKRGARMYKTGDVACYHPDGNITFLGRTDRQIKLRGFRIELGEIETILSQHRAVQQAVVLLRKETAQNINEGQSTKFEIESLESAKALVAYIVLGQEPSPTISELRNFVGLTLPDYMVPATYVFLATLPLTPNGKVNRQALPPPERRRPEMEGAYVAPRTSEEEIIAKIWAKLLKLEQVGVYDNFFDLGGHSLMATQIISKIYERLQVTLPIRSFFEAPTIAGLAKVVEANEWAKQSQPGSVIGNEEREEGEL